jgi:hypothetical protein
LNVRRFIGPLALLLTLFATFAGAAVVEEVAKDFKPLSGYVIMPVQGEFLIDRDTSHGVAVGDLFAVVKPGEKIVHPVTKEVLGTLDEVKGVLQVTRVKTGYAYARPVDGAKGIERGDVVHRYENLAAAFWDYTGAGETLFAELKAALSTLEWQEYAVAQAQKPQAPAAPAKGGPALVFILRPEGLEVRDAAFQTLRSYPAAAAKAPAAVTVAPAAPVAVAAPAVAPAAAAGIVVAPPAAGGAIVRSQMQQHEGVWSGPKLSGQPVGIEVGDIDGDGRKELAVAFRDRLEIARVAGGEYQPVAGLEIDNLRRVLALDGADLNGDGVLELYLTIAREKNLSSSVVECQGGRCRETVTGVPWFFRRVDLPGEGRVLLAQRLGDAEQIGKGEYDFYGPIFRVTRSGNELRPGEAVKLPGTVTLYGFQPFEADGGRLTANLSGADRLQVLGAGGEELWESQDVFGGSESFMERPDISYEPGRRFLYLKARLERGADNLVLVPVNEGSRISATFREFKKSHLKAMAWDGNALVEAWRTKPQEGYLADFRIADADNDGADEVVMVVMFGRGGLLGGGKSSSTVLIYELK